MTDVDELHSVVVSPESLINNQITNYVFTFRFPETIASAPLKSGDLINIQIPISIGIPISPLCIGNLSLSASLSCTFES